MNSKPRLTIIVVCFRMPTQIRNTIISLSPDYQQGIDQDDYEVIVLENSSDQQLSTAEAEELPGNFRYVLRQESSQSPAAAINEGLQLSRGEFIGLMIDGAYLLTPGVLRYALLAWQSSSEAFVTVPTYHLGPGDQALTCLQGYDLSVQQGLLDSISWPQNGYRLFEIGSICGANPNGFFASILESNCYFSSRQAFDYIGGADESFQQPGGGSINLDMTLKLGSRPGSLFFSLGGEGVFHQYHGGITTSAGRGDYVEKFNDELHANWDNHFHYFARNPIVLGSFSEYAHDVLQQSSQLMQRRINNCRKNDWPVWEDQQDHDI